MCTILDLNPAIIIWDTNIRIIGTARYFVCTLKLTKNQRYIIIRLKVKIGILGEEVGYVNVSWLFKWSPLLLLGSGMFLLIDYATDSHIVC